VCVWIRAHCFWAHGCYLVNFHVCSISPYFQRVTNHGLYQQEDWFESEPADSNTGRHLWGAIIVDVSFVALHVIHYFQTCAPNIANISRSSLRIFYIRCSKFLYTHGNTHRMNVCVTTEFWIWHLTCWRVLLGSPPRYCHWGTLRTYLLDEGCSCVFSFVACVAENAELCEVYKHRLTLRSYANIRQSRRTDSAYIQVWIIGFAWKYDYDLTSCAHRFLSLRYNGLTSIPAGSFLYFPDLQ